MINSLKSRKGRPKKHATNIVETIQKGGKTKHFWIFSNVKKWVNGITILVLAIILITPFTVPRFSSRSEEKQDGTGPNSMSVKRERVNKNINNLEGDVTFIKKLIGNVRNEFYDRYGGKDDAIKLLSKGVISPGSSIQGEYNSKDIEVIRKFSSCCHSLLFDD